MSIAIAHKDYAVAGGGELLAEHLGRTFDAPVYAGYVTDANRSDINADVRGLWNGGLLNRLITRRGITRAVTYRYLWQHVSDLHRYDILIQSGNEPLWYVPPDDQVTIAYTHSTPRWMYDLYAREYEPGETYREQLGNVINRVFNDYQRHRYAELTRYPDLYVANSELIARRIQRYWNIPDEQIRVVYPPIDVGAYSPSLATDVYDEYYLSVNRLSPLKRVDEIVEAFQGRDETLLVAGKGPEKDRLEDMAGGYENIQMLGYVPEREKRELLAGAKATVYNPVNEDFGIVPIESLASGTPLISVRDGYQRWQLDDGETAIMFDRSDRKRTTRNLRNAIARFEADGVACSETDLQGEAEQYRIERFEREMRQAVGDAVDRAGLPHVTYEPPAEPKRVLADGE